MGNHSTIVSLNSGKLTSIKSSCKHNKIRSLYILSRLICISLLFPVLFSSCRHEAKLPEDEIKDDCKVLMKFQNGKLQKEWTYDEEGRVIELKEYNVNGDLYRIHTNYLYNGDELISEDWLDQDKNIIASVHYSYIQGRMVIKSMLKTNFDGNAVGYKETWDYTNDGMIKSYKTFGYPSNSEPTAIQQNYAYNNRDQLMGYERHEIQDGQMTLIYLVENEYDSRGNLISNKNNYSTYLKSEYYFINLYEYNGKDQVIEHIMRQYSDNEIYELVWNTNYNYDSNGNLIHFESVQPRTGKRTTTEFVYQCF